MPTQNQTQASRTRALWVIAISLLIIAVCLVLIVSKLQLQKPVASAVPLESEVAAVAPEPERFPSPPPKPTNSSPRRPAPAIAQPPPPIAEPAVPKTNAASIQVLNDLAPLIAVVNRTPAPGNTIVGRITLRGMPPPERFITLNSQPSCPALLTDPPTTQDFVVGTNGELANVFVSILGKVNPQRSPTSLTNHQFTLTDCKITPLLNGGMINQLLRFRNQTDETHRLNVISTHDPSTGHSNVFRQVYSLRPGLTRPLIPFKTPEDFIQIECAQHPWEFAYVCVVESPFFAVTDTNGVFVIPNVPAGKYFINARHLKMSGANALSREVVVKADQPTEVDFTFDIATSQ